MSGNNFITLIFYLQFLGENVVKMTKYKAFSTLNGRFDEIMMINFLSDLKTNPTKYEIVIIRLWIL